MTQETMGYGTRVSSKAAHEPGDIVHHLPWQDPRAGGVLWMGDVPRDDAAPHTNQACDFGRRRDEWLLAILEYQG
jgi:hypothetical protein